MHKLSGDLLDTNGDLEGSKWIFVMSTSKRLYAGQVRTDVDTNSYLVISFPISSASQIIIIEIFLHCRKGRDYFIIPASWLEGPL